MYQIKIYWMIWYEYMLYDRNTTCVGREFVDLAMALLVFLYNNVYICFWGDISIIIKSELSCPRAWHGAARELAVSKDIIGYGLCLCDPVSSTGTG